MGRQTFSMVGMGIYYFLKVIDYAIFLRIILSWFVDPFSRIMGFLTTLTEPFVAPFRALLMRLTGGRMRADFSPILASFGILFLERLVVALFF